MRRYITLTVLIATPALAGPRDIPLVAIGMPFGPETPKPVSSSHPLYRDIEVGEIDNLPATIKSSSLNFSAAAKRSSVNDGLHETFARMNMLADGTQAARKRLNVSWMGSHTPFHIGTSNSATVTLHYRLVRVDTGQLLFDRDISTSSDGGGADASMRDNGIVRSAIAANFASAANCLDHAAYGTAPSDCALTPKFRVLIVRERSFGHRAF